MCGKKNITQYLRGNGPHEINNYRLKKKKGEKKNI